MSIYVMTLGELAKKRGEPVGDFVKKVQELGFDAGSHAKKLTQKDLDSLIGLLSNKETSPPEDIPTIPPEKKVNNPNVLLINLENGKFQIVVVDAKLNSSGEIVLSTVEQTTETSLGEALLEFRKQMGMRMGVN